MEKLMDYVADMGSIKINGINFRNGVGDGSFSLYFSEHVPVGFRKIDGVFFDLRTGTGCVRVSESDCNEKNHFFSPTVGLAGSQCLELAVNDEGDFCLVKMF